jgi:hypothetical protein
VHLAFIPPQLPTDPKSPTSPLGRLKAVVTTRSSVSADSPALSVRSADSLEDEAPVIIHMNAQHPALHTQLLTVFGIPDASVVAFILFFILFYLYCFSSFYVGKLANLLSFLISFGFSQTPGEIKWYRVDPTSSNDLDSIPDVQGTEFQPSVLDVGSRYYFFCRFSCL